MAVFSYSYGSLDQALRELSKKILEKGVWRKTPKNQEGLSNNILEFPGPVTIEISNPLNRYVYVKERKWNPYLPYLESLWILLGWNDLDDLPGKYVKNLYNFSDDGHTWRAGYGPRIRRYNGSLNQYDIGKKGYDIPQHGYPEIDQLEWVIKELQNDPYSRRAVITIHDPLKDSQFNLVTKDQPCTRSIHFMQSATGHLDCYVKMRSNDCFTYDTKIPLLNGEVWEIGKLAEEKANEEFWVYSRNEKGEIVTGKAHHPRKVRTVQKLVKVTLDNGEIIKCTPDHRFMLKDGSYKEIKDITAGESLAPLYRRKDKRGYEEIRTLYKGKNRWRPTHKISYESVFGEKEDKWNVLHHIDFNKNNNEPNNLQEMTWDDHLKLHQEYIIVLNDMMWNPEHERYPEFEEQRIRILEGLKQGSHTTWEGENSKEYRENQSQVMKEVNQYLWHEREGFREYMKLKQSQHAKELSDWFWNSNDPKAKVARKNISKAASKRMNSPEVKEYFREMTIRRNIENWNDPVYREKMSKKIKESWTEERKQKASVEMSERSKKMWKDPDFIKNQQKVQKENTTKQWQNPEYREHQLVKRKSIKRDQVLKIFKSLEEKNLILNERNFQQERLLFSEKYPSINYIKREFGTLENAKAELLENHKVISIEYINEEQDVYDLSVDGYHNFALEAGVFVHNCLWGFSAVNVFNFTWMQEYVSRILGIPMGSYYHQVDTLHVYEKFVGNIHRIAQEKQPYSKPLPPRIIDFTIQSNFSLDDLDAFAEDLVEREEKMWKMTEEDFKEYTFLSDNNMLKEWEAGILAYHWYKRLGLKDSYSEELDKFKYLY